jgi:hypothetical protein
MLGHAITTELQQLAARDRIADLAAVFSAPRVKDSTRDVDVRAGRSGEEAPCTGSLGRPVWGQTREV